MKIIKITVSVALLVLIAYGWLTVGKDTLGLGREISSYEKQGDKSYELGLYEDAYEKYTLALKIKVTKNITNKQIQAYTDFYQKEKKGDYSSRHVLMGILGDAIRNYPSDDSYAIQKIDLCLEESDFDQAKKVCQEAMENCQNKKGLLERWDIIITSVKEDYNYYINFNNAISDYFSVSDGLNWYLVREETMEKEKVYYEMLGLPGESGLYIGKKEGADARFYDYRGVARGIAGENVTAAGVYREGLCSVQIENDKWYFINLDGEKILGPYEKAGCFVDGKAAVKINDYWKIIDTYGNEVSNKKFYDIKLGLDGSYICENRIIAAIEKEKYRVYDGKLREIGNNIYEDADIATKDGLIAIKNAGKWGYINFDEKTIIEPQYSMAKSFSNGLAAVCQDDKWGLIKADNSLILQYQYQDAGYVSRNGSIMVSDETDIYHLIQFNYLQDLVK